MPAECWKQKPPQSAEHPFELWAHYLLNNGWRRPLPYDILRAEAAAAGCSNGLGVWAAASCRD